MATVRSASGRWTLTATSLLSWVLALYTWPSDAAAAGSSEKEAKRHSDASRPPMFGATFFVELSLNSTATDCNAAALENGLFFVCRLFRASQASSPTRSGRCDSVWPTLTDTGPRPAIAALSMAPRVLWSSGNDSWLSQAFFVSKKTLDTYAKRPATVHGLLLKKPRILSRSKRPRKPSYSWSCATLNSPNCWTAVEAGFGAVSVVVDSVSACCNVRAMASAQHAARRRPIICATPNRAPIMCSHQVAL
mmetsp:Transcript_20261/g.52737  ORF Transcript_20261/g.52737 Transcript_20261/m.52737 type:complete len:249 (-) Transcript_20261:42-788(-)